MTQRQLAILRWLAARDGHRIHFERARQVGGYASGGAAHWAVNSLAAAGFVAISEERPRRIGLTDLGRRMAESKTGAST